MSTGKSGWAADTPVFRGKVRHHWRQGDLVIRAMIGEGPCRGGTVFSLGVARKDVMDLCEAWRSYSRSERRAMLASVTGAIRQALRRADTLRPGNDRDLLDDLAILIAAQIALGQRSVIRGSGLAQLDLAVDPDTSLAWHQRGMLSPTEEEEYGVPPPAMPILH